ncbi:MAG: uracil phosphoribosyltransferase [Bacteroidia bacterium]|nr:uracil phosphoribosyltransferase [Bacteroidia bacterium]
MIINLGEQNSVFNQFVAEIRDEKIQNDSMRFRRNLERTGEIFAYEISKNLDYENREIQTPLGIANVRVFTNKILLATILRAGLPLHQGLLNIFDSAENAYISAYRKYHKDGSFDIKFEYISCPSTENKIIILSDPMLATGASMELAYKALLIKGKPLHTHIVTIIASKEGINYISKHLPFDNITVWLGAIDDELTVKSYIVPGLGDAGDLAFGGKE